MDCVVATPGRLAEHLKAGTLSLDACDATILDEVDVLLGDAAQFGEAVNPMLRVSDILAFSKSWRA